MPLSHPTQAERAVAEWHQRTRTLAFNSIATRMGAFRADEGNTIIWVFPDETTVEIKKRGAAYTITPHLP